MTDQDFIEQLIGDVPEPDAATIGIAFASVRRRSMRRRNRQRYLATAAAVCLLAAGTWAGLRTRSTDSETVTASSATTTSSDPVSPNSRRCESQPVPANQIGLAVDVPTIDPLPVPSQRETTNVMATFRNEGDRPVTLNIADIGVNAFDDSGDVIAIGHGALTIAGGPTLQPGESVTLGAPLPKRRCDSDERPALTPGTYTVAVTFTALTEGGDAPVLRSGFSKLTYR